MKPQISSQLRRQLAPLEDEVLDLVVREAQLLKTRAGDRSPGLDVWIERALKKRQRRAEGSTDLGQGVVVAVYGSEIAVETGAGIKRIAGCLLPLVVGDRVVLGGHEGEVLVRQALPRRAKLSKPDVGAPGREKVVAANIDAAVIVVSVVSPPLHPRLIDRFLIAIQNGGAAAMVCVNKMDLIGFGHPLPELDPYREIGLDIIPCSTAEGWGLEEVRARLKGKSAAFVGHSGVGKSSLVNALYPGMSLKTGETMKGYGRGAHTTTASSLHRFPDGVTLIDTPGLKTFGLWDATSDDVAASFPELAGRECRFRDCRHGSEPGCGVIAALAEGALSADRYRTYRRLLAEVEGGQLK